MPLTVLRRLDCVLAETKEAVLRRQAEVVRNGLGARTGACIDPKVQIVDGKGVCVVNCQRSPEPVFLKWKGAEAAEGGEFFVRSGPGTVKLSEEDAEAYLRTRFGA